MSDIDRLRDHLTQLATATPSSGRRIIHGESGDELKVQILREIDKTILPRRVSFQNERSHYVQFEVAARRIFRFQFSNSSHRVDDEQGFDGPILESPSDAFFNELSEQLNVFLAYSRSLKISGSKVEVKSDLSQVGCSASSLATAWSLELYASKASDQGAFLLPVIGACSEAILALAVFEAGKLTTQSGDPSCLARMREIDPDQLEGLKAKVIRGPDGSQDTGCIVFDMHSANGTALVLVQEADSFALLCVASSAVPKTLSTVQSFLR